jgi:RNA polymerase sigma-70 factor, ECF subfamily
LHGHSVRRTLITRGTIALPPDFSTIYAEWFHEVARWVRALGGLGIDHEDVTQEVFLVVRKKLHAFDGANVASWLYRIAVFAVREHRRRAWVRRVVLGASGNEELTAGDGESGPTPAALLERKEERRVLVELLSRMKEVRRTSFILYEVEGLSGEEIAGVQDVPVATVWTRLHYARKEFLGLVADWRRQDEIKQGKAKGNTR